MEMTNEQLEARLGWLDTLLGDEEASLDEKMDGLLAVLAEVRAGRSKKIIEFEDMISVAQHRMAEAAAPYEEADNYIREEIWNLLEQFFPEERHHSEAGTAQIVRPKNRISYDVNGLETLRKSSDEVERMIGHLRDESPSKPYLKVKLK